MSKFQTFYPGIYTDREKAGMEVFLAEAKALQERGPIDVKALISGTLPEDGEYLEPSEEFKTFPFGAIWDEYFEAEQAHADALRDLRGDYETVPGDFSDFTLPLAEALSLLAQRGETAEVVFTSAPRRMRETAAAGEAPQGDYLTRVVRHSPGVLVCACFHEPHPQQDA